MKNNKLKNKRRAIGRCAVLLGTAGVMMMSSGMTAFAQVDEASIPETCGSRYGYEDLGKRSNGEGRQRFYNDLYDAAVKFWNSDEDAQEYEQDQDDDIYGLISEVSFLKYGLDFDEVTETYFVFCYDNPQFYFAASMIGMGARFGGGGLDYFVNFLARDNSIKAKDRKEYQKKIAEYIDETAQTAKNEKTLYGKALAIHNKIIDDMEYAYVSTSQGLMPDDSQTAHCILGGIVNKTGVCESYSKIYQMMLNYCGMDGVYVVGWGDGGSHAWNTVKLDDGNYYFADVTWDDTAKTMDYFAKGTVSFGVDHVPASSEDTGIDFLYDLPEIPEYDFVPGSYEEETDKGDIDGDGSVGAKDQTKIYDHLKGVRYLSEEEYKRADLNGDGSVTAQDAVALADHVKGIRLLG